MNKPASNDMMEREFDILQSVSKLQPPAALYDTILSHVEKRKMTVSKKWFAAAAAVFAVVLCMEVFMVLQSDGNSSSNEIESLIQQENHQLYE